MGEAETGRSLVCGQEVSLSPFHAKWLGPLAAEYQQEGHEEKEHADYRDKTPEYALFMLNRQAVKNVTIALVPGEMKATIGDTTTLHLARRGESGLSRVACGWG